MAAHVGEVPIVSIKYCLNPVSTLPEKTEPVTQFSKIAFCESRLPGRKFGGLLPKGTISYTINTNNILIWKTPELANGGGEAPWLT